VNSSPKAVTLNAVNDETRLAVEEGRKVMKLLELHHKQQAEWKKARETIARRTADQVQRILLGSASGEAAISRQADATDSDTPAIDAAARIARDLPASIRRAIEAKLPSPLAEEFDAAIYSFDALATLAARDVQRVIHHADKRTLAIALGDASRGHGEPARLRRPQYEGCSRCAHATIIGNPQEREHRLTRRKRWMGISIERVDSYRSLREFIDLPKRIYAGCTQWVPMFDLDYRNFYRRRHPFFAHAKTEFLLVRRDRGAVARVLMIENERYNEQHGRNTAHFYFIDFTEDAEVVDALFTRMADWARERGLNQLIGPLFSGATYGGGVLIHGFEHRAAMPLRAQRLLQTLRPLLAARRTVAVRAPREGRAARRPRAKSRTNEGAPVRVEVGSEARRQ